MDQHLLSIILLTPLAGLAILLLIPGKSKDLIRVWANLVGFAGFLISLPLVSRFQTGPSRLSVRRERRLDPRAGRHLPHRHRWHQPAAHHAHHADGLHRHSLLLERHPGSRQGILRHVPAPADGHARRIHVARFLPLLRLLGTRARPDVLHHRRLGRSPKTLRRHQVLPVHPGGQRAHAARHPDPLLRALQPVRLLHV